MKILGTQFTLSNKAFEIYVAGCKGSPHCKGCHNPESWSFENGEKCDAKFLDNISRQIKEYDVLIKNVMIFGGEPLDQDLRELCALIYNVKQNNNKLVWIFTRYELEAVPDVIKDLCDYIKCGKYDEDLICQNNVQYGIRLATSNQCIYKKGVDY